MGGMSKALVDELRIEAVAHAHDAWKNKAVWNCRVCLTLLDNMKVDLVNIVFDNCLN